MRTLHLNTGNIGFSLAATDVAPTDGGGFPAELGTQQKQMWDKLRELWKSYVMLEQDTYMSNFTSDVKQTKKEHPLMEHPIVKDIASKFASSQGQFVMLLRDHHSPTEWVESLAMTLDAGGNEKPPAVVYELSLFRLMRELLAKVLANPNGWSRRSVIEGFRFAFEQAISMVGGNVLYISDMMAFLQLSSMRPITIPLRPPYYTRTGVGSDSPGLDSGCNGNKNSNTTSDVKSVKICHNISTTKGQEILCEVKQYLYQRISPPESRVRCISHATKEELARGMLLHGQGASLLRSIRRGTSAAAAYPRWHSIDYGLRYDIEAPLPEDMVYSVLRSKVKALKKNPEYKRFQVVINKEVLIAALELPPFEVHGKTFTGIFPDLVPGVNPDNALLWIQHVLSERAKALKSQSETIKEKKHRQLILDNPTDLFRAVAAPMAELDPDYCPPYMENSQNGYLLQQTLARTIVLDPQTIEQLSRFHEWDYDRVHSQSCLLRPEHEPVPTYLFIGPFNSGKLALARQWSDYLLGPGSECVVVDMNEVSSEDQWDAFCDRVRFRFTRGAEGTPTRRLSINRKLFVLRHATQCTRTVMKRVYRMLKSGQVETSRGTCYPLAGAAYVLTFDLYNFELNELTDEYLTANKGRESDICGPLSMYMAYSASLFEMQSQIEDLLKRQYSLPGFLTSRTIIFDELNPVTLRHSIQTYIKHNTVDKGRAEELAQDDVGVTSLVQVYTSGCAGREEFVINLNKFVGK